MRNVIKTDKRKSKDQLDIPSAKRPKAKEDLLLRRYPSTDELHGQVDEETAAQHCKLMNTEAGKTKPRNQIILPLMKVTYVTRSLYIRTEASSVKEILGTYAALKLPSVVSMHIFCCRLLCDRILYNRWSKRWISS